MLVDGYGNDASLNYGNDDDDDSHQLWSMMAINVSESMDKWWLMVIFSGNHGKQKRWMIAMCIDGLISTQCVTDGQWMLNDHSIMVYKFASEPTRIDKIQARQQGGWPKHVLFAWLFVWFFGSYRLHVLQDPNKPWISKVYENLQFRDKAWSFQIVEIMVPICSYRILSLS